MEPPSIDPDIRRARTLPSRFYTDADVFERMREHVLGRSWQLVLPETSWTDVPGHAMPFVFLEGSVEEPLVLVRGDDDVLRCLSNVCTHRGNLVVSEPCRAAHLRCIYHGRRFGLDGCMHSMPEFEQAEGFPSPADDLPRLPVERIGPFTFTAIDPRFPFDELTAGLRARLDGLPLDQLVLDRGRTRDYLVNANWALYCDNYLEGFHIPFVHAALAGVLDYGAYRTELDRWSSVQVGIADGGDDCIDLPPSSPDHGQSIAGYFEWLFPNVMFNVYPWGISLNVVKPITVNRTKVTYQTWVWDESRIGQGAGADLDRVEREDEMIVEMCQHGVRSRLYDRGRYSPTREQGVHHFHRLLAECLGE